MRFGLGILIFELSNATIGENFDKVDEKGVRISPGSFLFELESMTTMQRGGVITLREPA